MEQSEGGGDFPATNIVQEAATVSSTTTVVAAATEIQAKKLATQLDFTVVSASATTTTTSGAVHPEQSRPQPRFLPSSSPPPNHPPRPVHPTKNQSQNQRSPAQPLHQQQPTAVMTPVPSARIVKLDSLRPRSRLSSEAKDGTPKRPKQCNCKHSHCLKLYCECSASGVYCEGCNCVNCCNKVENDAVRREAVEIILEHNPNAFRPKIGSSPHGHHDSSEDSRELVLGRRNKGCHCKKSGCLKKYCECFQGNILCSNNCKCVDCKNFEGSEERLALFHDHANSMTYVQQAANAAIKEAIGSSGFLSPQGTKKRKGQELNFPTKEPAIHRLGQFSQANHVRPSGASTSISPASMACASNSVALGTAKSAYRPLLADIVQPHDVKVLCSYLVLLAQASKTLAENGSIMEKHADVSESAVAYFCGGEQSDKVDHDDSTADIADESRMRPLSPGMLALMCDEQDTMLIGGASSGGLAGPHHATTLQSPEKCETELYAEQERVVLTKFRDCLLRVIQLGDIKESKFTLGRSESLSPKEPTSNGSSQSRTDKGIEEEPTINGVRKHSIQPPIVNHLTITEPQAEKQM